MPPTLVQSFEQGFVSAPGPQPLWLVFGLSWHAGDLIVVRVLTEDGPYPASVAAAGAVLSFEEVVSFFTAGGKTPSQIFVATAGTTETSVDITVTRGGGGLFSGAVVSVWREHGGLGTVMDIPAQGVSTEATWDFTTVADNSAIDAMVGDAAGVAGAAGNWAEPPNIDADDVYHRETAGLATVYAATYLDAGDAGTVEIGVTTPTTMNWAGAAVEIREAVAPASTVGPAVTGTAQVGQVLTCSQGTWLGAPTPSFSFQWQHDPGSGWTNISGAASDTYTPIVDQIGDAIRCTVSASNTNGSANATSNELGPITPADLVFNVYLSGGASNDDPALSIGGAQSSELADPYLFDDVTFEQATDGLIDYRLVYLANEDEDDGQAAAYVSLQLEAGRQISIGVATEDTDETVAAIANDTTAPAGVTFLTPTTSGAGVDLGTIPAGEAKGVWLRRSAAPGTDADITNAWRVTFEVARL